MLPKGNYAISITYHVCGPLLQLVEVNESARKLFPSKVERKSRFGLKPEISNLFRQQ